jgi:hypothetical protein
MNKLKITDGDLVIITVTAEGGTKQDFLAGVEKDIRAWLAKRGLGNVFVRTYGHTGPKLEIDIKVLSVNNVFEDTVLR